MSEALRGRLSRWAEAVAPLVVLLALGMVIAWQSDRFATADNLRNVVTRNVPLALIAVGQTLVIISGQIDLSVGSVMALAAVCSALCLQAGQPVGVALAAALGVGAACGLVNGVVTVRARIPSFITTLAMMGLARGLALLAAKSRTVSGADALNALVLREFAGVLLPVWLLLLIVLLMALALARTVFGRNAYATGANATAARLSGVRVDRNVVLTFVLGGLLVGLAGAVETGRNLSAQPTMGELKELESIAAVVIGGASLSGGRGSIAGALCGALLLTEIKTGSTHVGLPNWVQEILTGAIILVAMALDRWREQGKGTV